MYCVGTNAAKLIGTHRSVNAPQCEHFGDFKAANTVQLTESKKLALKQKLKVATANLFLFNNDLRKLGVHLRAHLNGNEKSLRELPQLPNLQLLHLNLILRTNRWEAFLIGN